jgi:CRP/FNR family transcriptional regulator, cyclic AMP receptor protein
VLDVLRHTANSPDLVLADGDVIVREGERTGSLIVLVEGRLEVRRRDITVVRIDEPGAIVGELGLLLDMVASADVVADGPCVVRRMDDAEATFAANPAFARHLATMLAQRLWQISTYLTDLQHQYADRDDTLGLVPSVLSDLLGGGRAAVDPGSDRERESPY